MALDQDNTVEQSPPEDLQAAAPRSPARLDGAETDLAEANFADFGQLNTPQAQQQAGLKWVLGSGVVLLLGIGGWLGYQRFLQSPPEPLAVTLAPVGRADLEDTITESGVVELGGQQTFKAPSDVTVQAVLVEERERVSQGQVLLELRDRALQQRLADQIVQNRINQLTYQRQQEILAERQSRLADAASRLQDSADLLAQGFISEDDFRTDKRAFEDAQSAVRDAEVELTKADLQVQQDQVTTDSIRLQLEDNQIVAPMDAIVLKVEVKPGDGVEREGLLLSIGDPTQETIRLQLTTLNAARVGIGMPVRVSVIGPESDIFAGQIVRVSPQATSVQENAEQATVEAEVRLNDPSGALIPGSAVSVDIVLNQRSQALVVPVTAIQRDAENPYVWVKDANDRARQREVTIGLETLEAVEILSGLQAGDEIVIAVPPDAELSPGQRLATPETEAGGPDIPDRDQTPGDN